MAVTDGDTGRFLTTVLQCKQAVEGQLCDIFLGSPDCEDATFLAGLLLS